MKYIGKLYGKIGRRTITLKMTSEDVDKLQSALAELVEATREKWRGDDMGGFRLLNAVKAAEKLLEKK